MISDCLLLVYELLFRLLKVCSHVIERRAGWSIQWQVSIRGRWGARRRRAHQRCSEAAPAPGCRAASRGRGAAAAREDRRWPADYLCSSPSST